MQVSPQLRLQPDASRYTLPRFLDDVAERHGPRVALRFEGPLEFHLLQTIEAVEVNYLGETLLGDHLEVRSVENTAGLWFHSLTKSSGAEVCRARLGWKPPKLST